MTSTVPQTITQYRADIDDVMRRVAAALPNLPRPYSIEFSFGGYADKPETHIRLLDRPSFDQWRAWLGVAAGSVTHDDWTGPREDHYRTRYARAVWCGQTITLSFTVARSTDA